jgi:hypothetical protein
MALSEVVRRMNEGGEQGTPPRWRDAEGRAVVPHGFRSSFRDWAGETRPEGREVVERALAHTIKDKAEAAYARSDLLEKRRPLMDAWGEHCRCLHRSTSEPADFAMNRGRRAAPDREWWQSGRHPRQVVRMVSGVTAKPRLRNRTPLTEVSGPASARPAQPACRSGDHLMGRCGERYFSSTTSVRTPPLSMTPQGDG